MKKFVYLLKMFGKDFETISDLIGGGWDFKRCLRESVMINTKMMRGLMEWD